MRIFAQKQNQAEPSFNPSRSRQTPPAARLEAHPIPQSEYQVGGQAEQWLMRSSAENSEAGLAGRVTARFAHDLSHVPVHSDSWSAIQAKLTVNTPGDSYEQEADRVAEQVTQMPAPQLQRACACGGACPQCQTEPSGHGPERLQAQRVGTGDRGQAEAPSIVHDVLRSSGQPLDPATRAAMESRFGYDFSRVRVHTDDDADRSAQAIHAIAYTAGNHIAFGADQYRPHTSTGLRLLAHELTHVVQQTNAPAAAIQRQPAPAFPAKGVQVTGPDAKELVGILSACIGLDLTLDKSSMLQNSGKKNSSKTVSATAKQEILNAIKDPNGVIIDTDPSAPGALVGKFRPDQPGFHTVNIQQIKALKSASGASGGFEACSAIVHEITEAAKGRDLGVKGKTAKADLLSLSHQQGVDIENKIRADFKLPARNKTGDMFSLMYNFPDKSFVLSLMSNSYGSGKDLRTQLTVIKTPYVVQNNRPQMQGNEVMGSDVEKGAVELSTTDQARDAFKKFFPSLYSQVGSP